MLVPVNDPVGSTEWRKKTSFPHRFSSRSTAARPARTLQHPAMIIINAKTKGKTNGKTNRKTNH
jgi:hypothetical protein